MSKPSDTLTRTHARQTWLLGADPSVSLRQAIDEGRDPGEPGAALSRLAATPVEARDAEWIEAVWQNAEAVERRPVRPDHPYVEPDDWERIRSECPPAESVPPPPPVLETAGRLHGALLGRVCGCLLGKPVELWDRRSIELTARATGNWPLATYWRAPREVEESTLAHQRPAHRFDAKTPKGTLAPITHMPEDDDINYTLSAYLILKEFGVGFDTLDVADFWGRHLPAFHTCTAERVAYRNMLDGYLPPESATRRNPYREWIGAQIRADFYGWANPGRPDRAAEWAWRDARLSHTRNGLYGAMWVAAMLAASWKLKDVSAVVRTGLSFVPGRSRIAEALREVLDIHAAGDPWENVLHVIHTRWDEKNMHDWCHTISNAQVVAAALLWGGDDFTRTLHFAVTAGCDTDCNGATCGSIWGLMHGVDALPPVWTDPLQDTLHTGLAGHNVVSISSLAAEMAETIRRL